MLRKLNVPSPTLSVREALAALVRPLDVAEAERRCAAHFGEPHAVLFASARGALSAAAAAVSEGREIVLPAYTCVAVPNAMRSAGVAYRFTDVAADGTVPEGGWDGAQVALVQDTYGFPAAVPEGVVVVRDCAHRADLLQAGDVAVAVTSFEHSKWLSAGRGGLAVTRDGALAQRMRAARDAVGAPEGRLRHGLSTLVLLLLGRLLAAGRLPRVAGLLAMAGDLLAPTAVAGQSSGELDGGGVGPELLGAPNRTVARLVTGQLARGGAVGAHRRAVVAAYDAAAGVVREPLPLVRYPLVTDDIEGFERVLAQRGWDAEGRWFDAPLHPASSRPEAFGYRYGSAPAAEALAARVVNLPTHPLISEANARDLIDAALAAGARPVERP